MVSTSMVQGQKQPISMKAEITILIALPLGNVNLVAHKAVIDKARATLLRCHVGRAHSSHVELCRNGCWPTHNQ